MKKNLCKIVSFLIVMTMLLGVALTVPAVMAAPTAYEFGPNLRKQADDPKDDTYLKVCEAGKGESGWRQIPGGKASFLYMDGKGRIVYELPLDSGATEAYLILNVRGKYKVYASGDMSGMDAEDYTAKAGDVVLDYKDTNNALTLSLDVSKFISNGKVYLRVEKAEERDSGNGPQFNYGRVVYNASELPGKSDVDYSLGTLEEQKGNNYIKYTSGYLLEVSGGPGEADLGNTNGRLFMDGDNTVCFQIPINKLAEKQELKVFVNGDKVRVSITSDPVYDKKNNYNPDIAYVFDKTKGDTLTEKDSRYDGSMLVYDLKDYIAGGKDFVYVTVGNGTYYTDKTVNSFDSSKGAGGNGGVVYGFQTVTTELKSSGTEGLLASAWKWKSDNTGDFGALYNGPLGTNWNSIKTNMIDKLSDTNEFTVKVTNKLVSGMDKDDDSAMFGFGDNFVVKYDGVMAVDKSGWYQIVMDEADNGYIAFINNMKVIDFAKDNVWADDGAKGKKGYAGETVYLTAGINYPFTAYFIEQGGGEALKVRVRKDGGQAQTFNEAGVKFYSDVDSTPSASIPEIKKFDNIVFQFAGSMGERGVQSYYPNYNNLCDRTGNQVWNYTWNGYTVGQTLKAAVYYTVNEIDNIADTDTAFKFDFELQGDGGGVAEEVIPTNLLKANVGKKCVSVMEFEVKGNGSIQARMNVANNISVTIDKIVMGTDAADFSTDVALLGGYKLLTSITPPTPGDEEIIETINESTNLLTGSSDVYGKYIFDDVTPGVYKIAYYLSIDDINIDDIGDRQMRVSPRVDGNDKQQARVWIDWAYSDINDFIVDESTGKIILVNVITVPEGYSSIDAGFHYHDFPAAYATVDKVVLATSGYDFVADTTYVWMTEKATNGTPSEGAGNLLAVADDSWISSTEADPGNKTALNTAITEAKALLNGATEGYAKGNYTAGSKAVFQEAINKADSVSLNNNAKQAAVNAAVTALNAAKADFESSKLTIDKTELADTIKNLEEIYNGLDVGTGAKQYPQEVKDDIKELLDMAKELLNDNTAEEEDIDWAIFDIEMYIWLLPLNTNEFVLYGEQLDELILKIEEYLETAEEGTTPGKYKVGSKSKLEDAYYDATEALTEVLLSDEMDVEVIKSIIDDLQKALDEFEAALITINKTDLNAAISQAEALYKAAVEGAAKGQYKAGSKAKLQTAIDAAKAVAGNEDATQAEIDAALEALQAAIEAFEDAKVNSDPKTGDMLPQTAVALIGLSSIGTVAVLRKRRLVK